MEIKVTRLKLAVPLFYIRADGREPFPAARSEGEGETLFSFELDESQYRSFEPEQGKFFEILTFAGRAAGLAEWEQTDRGSPAGLPRGEYLFAQKREILTKEAACGMAFEIQQEGLWRRLKPLKTLYLRRLFEDGCGVTQLWRPFEE